MSAPTPAISTRTWSGGELYVDPEVMQGFGLGDVHGVAAFPNGEAQKSSFEVPRFNAARLFVSQTFNLGGERETSGDQQQQTGEPARGVLRHPRMLGNGGPRTSR